MAYVAPRYRQKKAKKCWCGSGRKQKNCHGFDRPSAGTPDRQTRPHHGGQSAAPPVKLSHGPFGVPGEEQRIWVVPVFEGQPQTPRMEEVGGKPGKYKVQLLLSRPGFPIEKERNISFIDELVGESHLAIAKPANDRDVAKMQLQVAGKRFHFVGLPNDQGFLGKLIVEEIVAANAEDAEKQAYEALAPFLSAWSMHLDIPVHIETIQTTELATHTTSLRIRAPHLNMNFASSATPLLSDEFCHYASLYREALNSNSSFYRFLCFYKIIESVVARRGRLNQGQRLAGQPVRSAPERIPTDRDGLLALLNELYPWRKDWDEMALRQLFPPEVRGKKVTYIRDHHLNPLRVGIAHALLKTGEVRVTLDRIDHIQLANKWLPLSRVLARLVLRREFPAEFTMAPQLPPSV